MDENKTIDLYGDTFTKIVEAVDIILSGKCSKVIVNDDVKVYKCTNIVRIDLKIKENV